MIQLVRNEYYKKNKKKRLKLEGYFRPDWFEIFENTQKRRELKILFWFGTNFKQIDQNSTRNNKSIKVLSQLQ